MRQLLRGSILVLVAVVAVSMAGCDKDPFCLDCNGNGDGGNVGPTADAGDGGSSPTDDGGLPADACVAIGAELCNGRDDDCNGIVDDAPEQVGDACNESLPAPCTAGVYECIAGELVCGGGAVVPHAESCNNEDDDCDGTVDDGDPGGGLLCGTDVGDCLRGVSNCSGGSIQCVGETPAAPEECDGRDNDCDGVIDNGNPEGGADCGLGGGNCVPGTETCVGGVLQCLGASPARIETCNGLDDDCDGTADDGFILDTDPNNCGTCGTHCQADDAVSRCTSRVCEIAFCLTDHWDVDGDYSNGCEYVCSYSGVEICNGEDDDCDGTADDGLATPNICASAGECAGATALCAGASGWQCDYAATVSLDTLGVIEPEANCDGLDNDCNGTIDDAFPAHDTTCSRGVGVCATSGVWDCNSTNDGLTCTAATPGSAPMTGELCNGLDDNCNGTVDEGAVDTNYVAISGGGITGTKYMMKYEASHPDSKFNAAGTSTLRACSNPDVLPWTNLTYQQASDACVAANARLCTETEWQRACQTAAGTACTWSYGSSCTTYSANTCNGNDYDFDGDSSNGNQDGLLPTETLNSCYADWTGGHIYDLSGNAKEWAAARSSGVNPLRGGSNNNTSAGLSCSWNFPVGDNSFQFPNVGFRCCRDTAP